jgi:SPP1 gp7 family putative phage head morphogenesis protein
MGSLIRPSLEAGLMAAQLQVNITLSTSQTSPYLEEYLKTETASRVKGINETTRNGLRATLLEGIQANESFGELKSRIEEVFTQAKGYRAGLISTNEVINAYSNANHKALEIIFEQGDITHHMWLSAEDDRVRPTHVELNRVVLPFEQKFAGEILPGDEINCRCVEIGITPEMLERYQ